MSDFDQWNKDSGSSPDPNSHAASEPAAPSGSSVSPEALGASPEAETQSETAAAMDSSMTAPIGATPADTFQFQSQTDSIAANTDLALKERKKTPVWVFAIGGGFVAILAIVIAFMTIPTLSNAFTLATMSPLSYYAKAEKASLSKNIDSFTKKYGETLKTYTKGDSNASIENSGDEINLKLTLDPSLTEGLGYAPLETLESKMTAYVNKEYLNYTLDAHYNGNLLGTVSAFLTMEAQPDVYFQIKELSDSYLKANIEEMDNLFLFSAETKNPLYGDYNYNDYTAQAAKFFQNTSLSEAMLNKLLKKYANLVIDEIENVTLEKKIDYTVRDMSAKNTKITVPLSPADLYRICDNVIHTMQADEDIIKVITESGDISASDYKAAMSLLSIGMGSVLNQQDTEPVLDMVVWVDKTGTITGRSFAARDEDYPVEVGYGHVSDKGSTAYQFYINDQTEDMISADGVVARDKDTYHGDLKLDIQVSDDSEENLNMLIEFKDVKENSLLGAYTLTCQQSPYDFNLILSQDEKTVRMAASAAEDSTDLFKLELDITPIEYKEISLPSPEQVYEEEQIESYLENSKLEEFIKNIGIALGAEDMDYFTIPWEEDGFNTPAPEPEVPEATPLEPAAPGEAPSANNLPEGVEADEYGYYSYEVDLDEIMAAGKAGDAYTTIPVKAADIMEQTEKLVKKYLGSLPVETTEANNTVSGYLDDNYGYEARSYETMTYWISEDDSSTIALGYDTVTNEVIYFQASLSDLDQARNALIEFSKVLGRPLSKEDEKALLKDLEPEEGETSAFGSYNGLSYYNSIYDDSYFAEISAVQ